MKQQKVALITGTSSGFGLFTSIELAKKGYTVIATMRNRSKKEALIELARKHHIHERIYVWTLDVCQKEQIQQIAQRLIKEFGRIDVLVNNAGISIGGFIEEVDEEDWQNIMETNFFGTVFVTQAFLPIMRQQQSGKIINVSSVSGVVGFPGYGPYAASKFAIEGFSESLRLEMAAYGVDVVLVEPGAYKTDIWLKGFQHIKKKNKKHSPYAQPFQTILSYSQRLTEKADSPIEVAKKIAEIAEKQKPTFRYPMGKGSLLAIFLKKWLPWKWFERMIVSQLKR